MNALKVIHLFSVNFLLVFLSSCYSSLNCSDIFCHSSSLNSEIVMMSSNSSITSWIPGNLEFISSVEIFISSFPSFQIGSFSWILVLIFLCLLLCPNFLYCFYDSYSSDLWKIPTRLILKSFSHCAIIFNLWRVNLSPDCWFYWFFSFIISLLF